MLKSNYGPVKLLDEGHRLAFQTPLKQYRSDPFDYFTFSYILLELDVLISIHVNKSIQINSSEAELLECNIFFSLKNEKSKFSNVDDVAFNIIILVVT